MRIKGELQGLGVVVSATTIRTLAVAEVKGLQKIELSREHFIRTIEEAFVRSLFSLQRPIPSRGKLQFRLRAAPMRPFTLNPPCDDRQWVGVPCPGFKPPPSSRDTFWTRDNEKRRITSSTPKVLERTSGLGKHTTLRNVEKRRKSRWSELSRR